MPTATEKVSFREILKERITKQKIDSYFDLVGIDQRGRSYQHAPAAMIIKLIVQAVHDNTKCNALPISIDTRSFEKQVRIGSVLKCSIHETGVGKSYRLHIRIHLDEKEMLNEVRRLLYIV